MCFLSSTYGWWPDGILGAELNAKTRAKFMQAIADARPERIADAVETFSERELKEKILEMEKCGCNDQAEEYKEALKDKTSRRKRR